MKAELIGWNKQSMYHKRFLFIIFTTLPLFAITGISKSISDIDDKKYELIEVTTKKLSSGEIPFGFFYGNEKSENLLSRIRPKVSKKKRRKEKVIEEIKEWKLKDGLTITLKTKTYLDFPAFEWLVYLSNKGKKSSQVISELYPIKHTFHSFFLDSLKVHTNKGDNCSALSYEPYSIKLKTDEMEVFQPTHGGKSTTGKRGWPYWNIQNDSCGIILALGWPGAWKCQMKKESGTEFSIKAGQGTFKSYLKPGETIRTPLVCLVFWENMDYESSQNLWRKFYIAHVLPKFSGKPESPATRVITSQADSQIDYVKRFIENEIKPRICWTDAGWYPTLTGDWLETGDWVMKPNLFPKGIGNFTKWAHQEGMESLLWFEPERVYNGNNYLFNNHKEWLVQSCDECCSTLNIGNKECLNWLIEHIDSMIVSNGLDWYREDMNGSGPQCLWDRLDSKDRKGIHENFYVQGHLALWDELKSRHKNLHIDACASGGRRNDIETMHRAVPLHRSDYQTARMGENLVNGNQAQTWALSSWFPYQGSSISLYDAYEYRSFYLPCFGMGTLTKDNVETQKKAYRECEQIQPLMLYGDYWPLTPYSVSKEKWIGWQFNRANEGDGCVQVFRRERCDSYHLKVKLRGLAPDDTYLISDFDSPEKKQFPGKELMEEGLDIQVLQKPGAAVLIYKRL